MRLEIHRNGVYNICQTNPNILIQEEPQTLEDVLREFEGEVNNAVTRQRIQFALERWNMRNDTNITIQNLNIN